MLLVADVKRNRRRQITAEQTGLDKLTARVQTVHSETHPRFHALLEAFKRRTGCSVLINTSFNVRGEPIVCSPEDAFRCFMGTDLDCLAIGNCFLRKADQNQSMHFLHAKHFDPD